jgi:hypothetical protein
MSAKRQAPAFTVRVTRQPLLQGLVTLLAGLSAASAIAGLALHLEQAWYLMPLALVVGARAWHLSRVVPRKLHWDGQCWRLALADSHESGPPVSLEVLMDFEHVLLLRAQGRVYLPFTPGRLGSRWGQLRATLYSARPEDPDLAPPHDT